jgi:uncharacterized protein (DUF1330 family)
MPAFAIAHLRHVDMGPEIVTYLERIDGTLAPFDGRFLVHGGPVEALEGAWSGALVVIAFPDRGRARAWYDSPEYRAILPLRIRNSEGVAFLIDGVSENHRATDVLAAV